MYENGGFTLENLGGDKGDWSWVRRTVHAAEWWLSCFPFLLSPGTLPAINLSTFYLHVSVLFNYKKLLKEHYLFILYVTSVFFVWTPCDLKVSMYDEIFFPQSLVFPIFWKKKSFVYQQSLMNHQKTEFPNEYFQFPFCMTFAFHFKEYSSLPPIKHFCIISDVFF